MVDLTTFNSVRKALDNIIFENQVFDDTNKAKSVGAYFYTKYIRITKR